MEWEKKVQEHYRNQAQELGCSKQSTMKDIFIRDQEVSELIKIIGKLNTSSTNLPNLLEIGCGNGYFAEKLEKQFQNKIVAVDFNEELLEIAKQRGLKNTRFKKENATKLTFADNSFDIVLTERCLINLESWEEQKKSLEEIWRILRPEGVFILMEAFADGWKNINEAREVIGLSAIPPPHHNVFFEKEVFLSFVESKFERINLGQKYNFLSSYYFGSRVLYPALIDQKKELVYNNKFVEFFSQFPPVGNYGPIQLFILKKRI